MRRPVVDGRRRSLAFYPKDWLGDLELRMCSAGARGLWIDLMCVMCDGVPYGHLTFPEELVLGIVNTPRERFLEYVAELETVRATGKSVAYRTEEGVLYSKRMVQDEQKRATNAANGRSGGNPALIRPTVVMRPIQPSAPSASGFDAEAGFKQLWDAYPAKGRVEITLAQTYFCEEIRDADTLAAAVASVTTGKFAKSEKWAKGFILSLPRWIHNRAWETESPEQVGGDKPGGPAYRKWEPPKATE